MKDKCFLHSEKSVFSVRSKPESEEMVASQCPVGGFSDFFG